jgi:hypothetical protein
MIKNKYFFLTLALLASMWILIEQFVFPCSTSSILTYVFWLSVVFIAYGFYRFFKGINKDFFGKDVAFALCTLVIILIGENLSKNKLKYDINKYGGIVKAAEVSRIREGNRSVDIYLTYTISGKTIDDRFPYDRAKLWKLKEGDTMLVVCPLMCTERSMVYDDFPTEQVVELCRDSAFYVHGKLISSEEYHSKYLE